MHGLMVFINEQPNNNYSGMLHYCQPA